MSDASTHPTRLPPDAVGLFIDGHWTAGRSGRSEVVTNPATLEEIGSVPHAAPEDLDEALAAAERGFRTWRDTAVDARTRILLDAARLLRERAQHIAGLMTLEQGKPRTEALNEVMRVAGAIVWDAEEARRAYGRVIPSEDGIELSVIRQPVGPVAAFTPWNFPAGSPNRKIAAALAAGCSIVIKASEEVPATACALVRCYADAGVPAGVLNLVFGVPALVSQRLIESPVTRFVAFTGSIPVGKQLAAMAAAQMKPHIMELGGHAPVIICADADPRHAARACLAGKIVNAGQVCTSPSRFFVHQSLHDDFLAELVAATQAVIVGDGFDPKTQMGPLVSRRRLHAIESLVDDAVARSARLACGGHRIGDVGCFYAPTVLHDVPDNARILVEEPFGPLLPVIPFQSLDEAIAKANALPYGLAAYCFTSHAPTVHRLTRVLEAGILSVNHTAGSVHQAPSGGWKQSGYGREGGPEGLDGYLVTKRIHHKLL